MTSFTLRRADNSDLAFIRALHEASMRPHVERQFGAWDADFQRQKFQESMIHDHRQIIEVEGADAGMLNVIRDAEEILLDQIWLLPQFQGRGIGQQVIRDLTLESTYQQKPIILSVLLMNPAVNLYKRLGFTTIGETETHYKMRREPNK